MAEESLNSGNDVKRIETLLGLDLDEKDEARVAIYIQQAKQAIMVYIRPYL